jgi:hypothetical protein
MPISWGFLAFSAVAAAPSHIGNGSGILALFVNGSETLVVAGRDMDATWRSLGTLCRELDWSKPRLLYELQNGLRYRTVPPGHTIDWNDPEVQRSLDVEASTVRLVLGAFALTEGGGAPAFGIDSLTVGIEVLPPIDVEVTLALAGLSQATGPEWAVAATRALRAAHRISEGATKADLARLLATEAETAVKAGQLRHALKASYLENQLTNWGIWPLSSFTK